MKRKPVILIEFNELCPPLLERWMGEGKLPNFQRFFQGSAAFTSVSDEPAAPNLEPWIQWYSLHTGLPFSEHRVFHLTDGPRAGHPDIWEVLTQAGLKVGNFGSMNAKCVQGVDNFFLPDPWCGVQEASPHELEVFHDYVSSHVVEYTKARSQLGLKDHARFLWFLIRHGLSFASISQVLRQLISEVTVGRHVSWRRASLLDRLQFDVFAHYVRRKRPQFATFFVNSTAHFQHSYWREMEPEKFTVKPTPEALAQHRDAVLFGYQRMDALLEDFFALEKEGAHLILATALSQQPFLKWEGIGGQHFYRPHDVERLVSDLGISAAIIEPVMTHQYRLRFETEAAARSAVDMLKSMSVDGQALFGLEYRGGESLMFGASIRTLISPDAKVTSSLQLRTWRLGDLFYMIDATKSGCHHPDGVLWWKFGTPGLRAERVSILDIMPTLLDYFGVAAPAGSKGPGSSLLRQIEAQQASAPVRNAA